MSTNNMIQYTASLLCRALVKNYSEQLSTVEKSGVARDLSPIAL